MFSYEYQYAFIVMVGVLMIFALIAIGMSLVIVAFQKLIIGKCDAKHGHCTNMLTSGLLFPI